MQSRVYPGLHLVLLALLPLLSSRPLPAPSYPSTDNQQGQHLLASQPASQPDSPPSQHLLASQPANHPNQPTYLIKDTKKPPEASGIKQTETHERKETDPVSADIDRKKIHIIIVVLCCSLVGALILTMVNVLHDREEMIAFYKGFMGRKLMISERRLMFRSPGHHRETQGLPGVTYIQLQPWGQETGLELLVTSPPSNPPCKPNTIRYVEDEEPEWRYLDYGVDVGPPPTSFCSFLRQYDLGMFCCDHMTPSQVERTQNLMTQFRGWKKRKRKNFSIVVTERVRREMSDQEDSKNKRRQGGGAKR